MTATQRRRIGAGFILATGLVLLSNGAARAGDQKQYSGNICHPFYPAEKTQGQGIYHTVAGLQNASADRQSRMVMCPFQRDTNSNTNGLQDLNVGVSVSSGLTATINCTAIAATQFGSTIIQVTRSAPFSTGHTVLAFGNALNQSVALGSYDMSCTLDYGGFINSIEYIEP